jgi:hypothetical protein
MALAVALQASLLPGCSNGSSGFVLRVAELARSVGTSLAMAAQAEPVVGTFQADDFQSPGIGLNRVAGNAAKISGGLSVVTTGAVLDLPVQLVHKSRRLHLVFVTACAGLGFAEGLMMTAHAVVHGLDMRSVVELDRWVEVGQYAE